MTGDFNSHHIVYISILGDCYRLHNLSLMCVSETVPLLPPVGVSAARTVHSCIGTTRTTAQVWGCFSAGLRCFGFHKLGVDGCG